MTLSTVIDSRFPGWCGVAGLVNGSRSGAGFQTEPEAARHEPAPARFGRDGLVTRPVCLTGETFAPKEGAQIAFPGEAEAPFFVDWLTISQDHPAGGLPCVDAGTVWASDDAGEIEWKSVRRVQHEGSFETSVSVRCDGFRVEFSGNVSRFGRGDNLFGFSLSECFERVNAILAYYGLPPFTPGRRIQFIKRGAVRMAWTGARISRVDVTVNFESGSASNAHAVLQYLGSQHVGRQNGRVLGDGETVDWGGKGKGGKGSKRQYWKAYIKHLELQKHQARTGLVDPRVIEHCELRGVVRFEGTIRSNALTDLGCAYLGDYVTGWAMPQLVSLFGEHTEVFSRVEQSTDDLDDLPKHLRGTARDYLAGMDCASRMSRATFFRHRSALLPFGIDISMRNIVPFKPRVRVVELTRAVVPSWYQLAA